MKIDEAYSVCRAIAHKHGGNFSVGFRFLPAAKRHAVYAAYAFCRVADDIADEEVDAGDEPVPAARRSDTEEDRLSAESRLDRLDAWQRELDAAYEGRPAHSITVALADALQRFAVPKEAFEALLDGCRQDMMKTRYESFTELLGYCELVAASISDISLAIFGYRSDAAIGYGRDLATALQLTNVTRDIGDDLSRGRVYLPQEELRRFHLTEHQLFARTESEEMRQLIEFQITRAEHYFQAAEPLLAELDFDARFPTLLMGGVYATVLAKLRKDPLIAVRQRLSLTKFQKVLVVGSRILRPHFL